MGKDKKKKGKGAEKTAMKTDKKLAAKQKKLLEKLGEADIAETISKLEAEEARLKTVVELICEPPSPRSNFTLVAHPEKEEIILFGGEFFNGQKTCIYNDLFIYNVSKNEWKQIKSPSGPAPRSGHQMVAIATDGGQLWMFGGEYASPSQSQFYHFKDLWVMRLKTKSWEKINAPNGPSARSGHRMICSKKKLIVFGGFHDNNQSYKYHNDLHMFSLESYLWMAIEIAGPILPPPRSGCCMAACPDGKILIWGGYTKSQIKKDIDRGVTHSDMFALLPDKLNPTVKYKWTNIKPGGYKPNPRSSVGFTSAPNGKSYCFGGVMDTEEDEENLKGQFGDELLVLDLTATTWRFLEIKSKLKKETSSKVIETKTEEKITSMVTDDGVFTMTVGGGMPETSSTATKIPSLFPNRSKSIPSPRMNPGLCVCKGSLYLFGGIFEEDDKQHTFNDFYSLDLHKMDQWKVLIPNDMNAHDWIDSDNENSTSDSENDDDDDDDDDDSESESEMDTD